MTPQKANDAVGHFSNLVKEFDGYYGYRPDFQERLDIWHPLLDRHCVRGGTSIDMGCGTGIFSFYLAQKEGRVVGVDGSEEMVKFCEDRRREQGLENIRFVEGRLPLIDETALPKADLVISSSVVEYVADLDASLALFARLLKPRATLILSMPNLLSISRTYARLKHRMTGEPQIYRYILHFTSPSLLRLRVRRYGLKLEETRYYAHDTRLARLTRKLRLPLPLTEDLVVAVFRKT